MALSKELIELHKDAIQLQSEKWKGSRFEIHLPLSKDHLDADEIVTEPATGVAVSEDIEIYMADNTLPILQKLDAQTTPKEYSILIIEDSADLRQFLKYRLEQNFDIYEANTGNAGLNIAYEIVPDLIISDIALPGNDGFIITETLKADIRSSHIPVIILTANSNIEKQITSMKLTASAFITKPFNLLYMEETIKSLLKNRKLLREHYTSEASGEIKSVASKIDRKFMNEFPAIVEEISSMTAFGRRYLQRNKHLAHPTEPENESPAWRERK